MLPDELHPTEVRASDPGIEDVFVALLRQREQQQGKTVSPYTTIKTYAALPEDQHGRLAIEAKDLTRSFGNFTAVNR